MSTMLPSGHTAETLPSVTEICTPPTSSSGSVVTVPSTRTTGISSVKNSGIVTVTRPPPVSRATAVVPAPDMNAS